MNLTNWIQTKRRLSVMQTEIKNLNGGRLINKHIVFYVLLTLKHSHQTLNRLG